MGCAQQDLQQEALRRLQQKVLQDLIQEAKQEAKQEVKRELDSWEPCRLWVVRHGERADEDPVGGPEWLLDHPDGWYDPPLTKNGKRQAAKMAVEVCQQLEQEGPLPAIGAIYCSPFKRALQTAEPLAAALRLPICVVQSLAGCTAVAHEEGLALIEGTKLVVRPSRSTLASTAELLVDDNPPPSPRSADGYDLPLLDAAGRAELCPAVPEWFEEHRLVPPRLASEQLCASVARACAALDGAAADGAGAAGADAGAGGAAASGDEAEAGGAGASSRRTPLVLIVAHRELMYDFYERPDVDTRGHCMGAPEYASVFKLARLLPGGMYCWAVHEMPKMRMRTR